VFKLVSTFSPTGDQPQAIEKLTENIKSGLNKSGVVGRYRFREDFCCGKCDKKFKQT